MTLSVCLVLKFETNCITLFNFKTKFNNFYTTLDQSISLTDPTPSLMVFCRGTICSFQSYHEDESLLVLNHEKKMNFNITEYKPLTPSQVIKTSKVYHPEYRGHSWLFFVRIPDL